MAQPAPVTTDRLPWLTEVPRAPAPEPKPKRGFRWEWPVALLIVLAAAAAAFWWFAARERAQAPVVESNGLQDSVPQVSEVDESAIPSVSDMTEPEPTLEQKEQTVPPAPRRGIERPRHSPAETDAPTVTEPSGEEVQVGPVIAIPAQPVVRGRLVQIGAYPTRAQADLAWQYVVRKWPYLATKPKLVSPIEVRSTDGKGTRMYRLQLATSSQAQSVVICQRLEAAKTSCVVVY